MPINYNSYLIHQPAYQITELQTKAQNLIQSGRPIINATIGDPKDDTPWGIRDALINRFKEQSFSQYPPHVGLEEFRSAVSNWANRHYQSDLHPDRHVLSCNGTKEAIFSFPLLFDFNDELTLIPSLSYPVYESSAQVFNRPIHKMPLTEFNQFLPDLDSLSTTTLNNTQLFWINSPHNPTTTVADKQYLEKLVGLAERHNFLICSDECYNDLYDDVEPCSILGIDSTHWVCFRSLSKRSHMTGYRSGAILSKNETLIAHLKKLRSPMGIGTPSFIQSAATWAWDNDDHVQKHRRHYQTKRKKIRSACLDAGLEIFGGNNGFYLWLKSPRFNSSMALSDWFLNKNILVTPGTVFGDDGNPYVRLVFCLNDNTLDLMCDQLSQS